MGSYNQGFVVLQGLYGALQDAKRLASETEKAWLILEFLGPRVVPFCPF